MDLIFQITLSIYCTGFFFIVAEESGVGLFDAERLGCQLEEILLTLRVKNCRVMDDLETVKQIR